VVQVHSGKRARTEDTAAARDPAGFDPVVEKPPSPRCVGGDGAGAALVARLDAALRSLLPDTRGPPQCSLRSLLPDTRGPPQCSLRSLLPDTRGPPQCSLRALCTDAASREPSAEGSAGGERLRDWWGELALTLSRTVSRRLRETASRCWNRCALSGPLWQGVRRVVHRAS
jgi:hypothetical protein